MDPEVLRATLAGHRPAGTDRRYALRRVVGGSGSARSAAPSRAAIELSDVRPPVSYHMTAIGRGPVGVVTGEADFRLRAEGEATAAVSTTWTSRISGRLASIGQRLVESSMRSLVRDALQGLSEEHPPSASAGELRRRATRERPCPAGNGADPGAGVGHHHDQRPCPPGAGGAAHAARALHPRAGRPHRHQHRLRDRAVRGLHGAAGRRRRACLHATGRAGRRARGDHHRGACRRRHAAPSPTGSSGSSTPCSAATARPA